MPLYFDIWSTCVLLLLVLGGPPLVQVRIELLMPGEVLLHEIEVLNVHIIEHVLLRAFPRVHKAVIGVVYQKWVTLVYNNLLTSILCC